MDKGDYMPNFLVVGTAKAGTTTLFHYLSQHPEVFIPQKETFFFISEIFEQNKLAYPFQRRKQDIVFDSEQYFNLYKCEEATKKVKGEIATGYLYYYEKSIPKIKKHIGNDVKIIIILRNPVQRAISSYYHFYRDGFEKSSFLESLQKEETRKSSNYDFMWFHKDLGLYADSIEAFLFNFKNIHVVFFDDLIGRPKETLLGIMQFLGIKQILPENLNLKSNSSGEPRSKLISQLLIKPNFVKDVIKKVLSHFFTTQQIKAFGKSFLNSVRKINVKDKKSEISEDVINSLKKFYQTDIEKLQKIIKKDLNKWV